MFTRVSEYFTELKNRFIASPHNDRSMMLTMVTSGIYTAIRAANTDAPVNIPLVGNTQDISTTTRVFAGLYVGSFIGSNFGNRFGQILDAFENSKNIPLNNELFLLRTLPILFAIGVDAYLVWTGDYGGNPLFGSLDTFTTGELYVLTALNAAYVGGTIAMRAGRSLDLLTNKQLVADFGIYSASKKLSKIIKDKVNQIRGYEPINDNRASMTTTV